MVIGYSIFFPQRVVREITILKGGEKLLIEVFGPYGMTRSFDVPVSKVSAVWGSKIVEREKTFPLKVKGMRFFFQLYVDDGEILDQKLFDDIIAVQRFEVRGNFEK